MFLPHHELALNDGPMLPCPLEPQKLLDILYTCPFPPLPPDAVYFTITQQSPELLCAATCEDEQEPPDPHEGAGALTVTDTVFALEPAEFEHVNV